jgi:hypothetical protein
MILAAVPSLVAGCLGSGSNTSTGLTTTRTTATNTSTTVTDTTKQPYDLIPANPASMTENEVRQQLVDHNCVELLDLPMTCPADDGQLTASVSPTVGEIPGTTVEFTVENSADEPFETNHYDWTLQKWDGSSWRRIAPLAIPAPLDEIPPGESHTYRIMPVEDELIRSRRAYIADSGVTIGGLGPGVYGFSTQGHFESTPEDEIGAAAVFGFAGEGSPVRPTDDVTGIERNGTTLTVRADASADRRGELVVSFVDGESDTQLLSEHVRQLRVLLNVLPYAATDGIENIRYVGHADDVDIVDTYLSAVTPDGAMKYRFRDYVFELSKSEK